MFFFGTRRERRKKCHATVPGFHWSQASGVCTRVALVLTLVVFSRAAVTVEWPLTLFTYTLPLDIVADVWSEFFREGYAPCACRSLTPAHDGPLPLCVPLNQLLS